MREREIEKGKEMYKDKRKKVIVRVIVKKKERLIMSG